MIIYPSAHARSDTMSKDMIDSTLDEMRRNGVVEPTFRNISRSFDPVPMDRPDPKARNLMTLNVKTGVYKPNMVALAEYLRDCGYRWTGDRILEFDGRFYSPVQKSVLQDALVEATYSGSDSPPLTRSFMDDTINYWKSLAKPGQSCGLNQLSTLELETTYGGWLIPFENGLYSVRDDILLPFTSDLIFDTCIHADYVPDEDRPDIEKVYDGIFDDPQVKEFFYLAIGYTLYSPTLVPPAIFLLLGPGGTGKSAILHTLEALLGNDNVANMSLVKLSSQFGLSRLKGLAANLCDEAGRRNGTYTQVDSDLLKAISAGRPWEIEQKFKDVEQYHNVAKLWFAANSMPDFGDSSSGMMRRIFAFPCVLQQDECARIYDVMDSPRGRSWLAFKALKAFLKFRWDGTMEFAPPARMVNAVTDYAVLDSVSEYILEATGAQTLKDKEAVRSYFNRAVISDEYASYCLWSAENGYKNEVKKATFRSRVCMDFDMVRDTDNVFIDSMKTSRSIFLKSEEYRAKMEKRAGRGRAERSSE